MTKIKSIHILGICGTFMGGVAMLAREMGFDVSGSDQNVYPPMSTQLESQHIKLMSGYDAEQLNFNPDEIIIGNALSRGKPVIEAILNEKLKYSSGPEWVANNILKNKHVIAISGTHGKTTTTSMVAWILEYAGLKPGFLIGGIPDNFGISARLGAGKYFVIEADEYDSAFFDKRSKFIHYHPDTLILNNLEFDHADIFADLAAIQTQFQYLIRTVPESGLIIINQADENLAEVISKGCWSHKEYFSEKDFSLLKNLNWNLLGKHNQLNAIAAIKAAQHVGVSLEVSLKALSEFKSVKRRLEILGEKRGIVIYDDFAHHPTAIKTTLEGLREKVGTEKIIAVLECASNTMKLGVHKDSLAQSLDIADEIIFLRPVQDWGIDHVAKQCKNSVAVLDTPQAIIDHLVQHTKPASHIVLMSNGGFGGLSQKLLQVM
jgi:UDP-N-acetylmuramate: L-alanyl-gamma-D-glutamyl-meso-diaminopimelate ligase